MVGAEMIANATRDYILASQTAKLAAVEARYTDPALDLRDFVAVRISDPDRESETDYPLLFIMPDSANLEWHMGHSVMTGTYRFELAVLVWAGVAPGSDDSQAETVKRLSMRYLQAVVEMLSEMHDHSASTYHVGGSAVHWGSDGNAIEAHYQPVYVNRNGGEWLGDARLIVGVEHTEAAT